MSVNRVILVGNVGTDPEIRFVETRQAAEFRLATTEPPYTSPSGAQIPERTEWHNIVMWDRAAQMAEKYVRKGTRLYIEGKLRTRTWTDRAGMRHTRTSIVADNFEILK